MSARGVVGGVAAALLLAAGAAVAPAQTPADTSTGPITTVPVTTTTTVPVTTVATTTVATTTEAATTTAPPATTTTAPPATTTTRSRPAKAKPKRAPGTLSRPAASKPRATLHHARAAALVTRHALGAGCPLAAAALLLPGRRPLLVTPAARGAFAYPDGGAVVSAASVELRPGACTRGRPRGAGAQLQTVSLLDGAVTATGVGLRLGRTDASAVTGLAVAGRATPARAGARVPLGSWGYVVVGGPAPVAVRRGGLAEAALAVHLIRGRDGLPPGTIVLVPAAGSSRHAHRLGPTHEPLTVTPPLALRHYVFPVAGQSAYSDTYGAFRGDVPGNWHHGDDIFANLGTPVVAVSDGTINRVGWEQLGGWRLWVRDPYGDEFYYAHLSGYAPSDLRSNVVHAGEVIGFVGNTGDAFTTSPHLHFEVHPRQLLRLGYDGAVDPTTYLDHWTHLAHVLAPRPAHPPLPTEPALRQEARYVWRELLAARHLIRRAPPTAARPHVRVPASDHRGPVAPSVPVVAAAAPRGGGSSSWPAVLIATLVAVGGLACLAPLLNRRRAAARRP